MLATDPHKWVEMLESLFGPRLGKFIAVCLLGLGCLAAAVFLLWIIWDYGGKAIFEFVSELSARPSLENIDAAVATLIWAMIAYGVIIVAILFFFGRALFRRHIPQAALDGLAVLRNRAIKELWAVSVDKEGEYVAWKSKYDTWHTELLEFVKNKLPQADYLNIEYLGVLQPRQYTNLTTKFFPSQTQYYRFRSQLERRLEIIELILNAYRGR